MSKYIEVVLKFPIPINKMGEPLYTEIEKIKQYHIGIIKRHVCTWKYVKNNKLIDWIVSIFKKIVGAVRI